MTQFSWLHLTDLHLGQKEQRWLFPNVKNEFFRDLRSLHRASGPWDLVLFSGDLTQSGEAGQFEKLEQVLDELWGLFWSLGSSPCLLAVPGNHDLDRPDQDMTPKIVEEYLANPDSRAKFWDADRPRHLLQTVVKESLANYKAWWDACKQRGSIEIIPGVLPGDFSATVEKGQVKLGILGLNTTYLQLVGGVCEGRLDLHPRQFHSACGDDGEAWADSHHACLLMTHQPPGWLTPDARAVLNGEIAKPGRFAVHLFGHMHGRRSFARNHTGGAHRGDTGKATPCSV